MAFVKLDRSILDSTLWLDRDARDLFLTALLSGDPHEFGAEVPVLDLHTMEPAGWSLPAGWYVFARAAGPALVAKAGLKSAPGFKALERLTSPEASSRSQAWAGRRLARVDGGYVVLNGMRERDRDHGAADRMRKLRARRKALREEVKAASNCNGSANNERTSTERVTGSPERDASSVTVRRNVTHYRGQSGRVQSTEEEEAPPAPAASPDPPKLDTDPKQVRLAAVILDRFPPEFAGDLETVLALARNPLALSRELAAILDGMHGPKVEPARLGQAVRDILLAGGELTGARLRGYARRLVERPPDRPLEVVEDGEDDEFDRAARALQARYDRDNAARESATP